MKYIFWANIIMAIHFVWIGVLIWGTFYIMDVNHNWYVPWHLSLLSGTLLLNLFLGFCPLTVWEEKLRKKINPETDFHNAFVATYIRLLLGIQVGKRFVFWTSFSVTVVSYITSILALTIFK